MTNLTENQLLQLARDAYNDSADYSTSDHQGLIPDGYQEVSINLNETQINPQTNKEERIYEEAFQARSYYNPTTNDLIIAPAGTNDLKDLLVDDPGYVLGYQIPQFDDAERYYDAVIDQVGKKYDTTLTKENITLTGHSHGGGLAAMVGIYKGDVKVVGFNAPDVARQLDNLENFDDSIGDQIEEGQLTSRDPSSFNIKNIVLDTDLVHNAGEHLGERVEIDSKGSIWGTVLYAISGVAGGALLANPLGLAGGVATGLLTKFFGAGITVNHFGAALQEALDNQSKSKSETTFAKFEAAVGSIDNFLNEGISSVVEVVNGTIDWITSNTSDLNGVAKDSWSSTVDFFKGLFNANDGSAPTNTDGTVNFNLIDNSLLNLTIETDDLKNSSSNQDSTQVGNVIDGGDYQIEGPIDHVNGDGIVNVAPWLIAGDGYRPGNQELSQYSDFSTELNADFSRLDDLSNQLNQNQSPTNLSDLNFQLQNPLANITNNSINARDFLNIDPVILDLNGDGVKLTSYADSEVSFDVDNDGKKERTGWVSKEDGMLVDDVNQDGVINDITETISEYYNPNDGSRADSDGKYSTDGLAALKKLDSNNDEKFNSLDDKWNDLRVWQDDNGNGLTDLGELKTLSDAGIKEIHLDTIKQANKERSEGNIIFSKTTYTTTDDETKQVAAVDFTTNPIGYEFNDVNLGKLATAEDGTSSLLIKNQNGENVTASEQTAQNIFGNLGDDVITGDGRNNWISGGAGSDTLSGGAGDDILIIDSEDKQENIDGGEGRDIAIINSDKGVSLNLAQSNIETAIGGNGDDVLISGGTSNVFVDGGSGDDIIIGGAADDALSGSDGEDYIDGGYGDDILRGHRGNDVIIGGKGNDYLQGGLNDDKIFGGEGNDIIVEGAGNDEIDAGAGYDLVKYNGSYKDYKITRDGVNYKVKNLITGEIDSIKNAEGIRFADVTLQLNADNISPLPVADLISIANKKDTVFISKEKLLANDLDAENEELIITSVQNFAGGIAKLVKTESGEVTGVEFSPKEGFIGNMSFDYAIQDSRGSYSVITQENADGSTETAAMNARVTFKLESDPNDALYSKQWYLSEINVQKAWEDYTGKDIKIGVFEKGDLNVNHQDLDDNVLQSHKEDIAFRQVDQFAQHATTIAGVIAAERNDYGTVGVAYDAKLDGYSWDPDASGLDNLKNVDIANNSWGEMHFFNDNIIDNNSLYQNHLKDIQESIEQGRDGLGTINIFAGGNSRQEGDNVNYHSLQNSRFVTTTGSINQPGDLATLTQASTPFSNPGAAILVSAPGSNINSTGNNLTNSNGSQFLGEFSASQGTSFSAPIVSGVVALMLEANPNLGYRDVQKILALSARQFNDPDTNWQENGATNWNGGAMHFSHDYGYGIVDAGAAVRLAETWQEVSHFYNENSLTAENSERVAIVDNDTVGKQFSIADSNMHNIETVEVEVDLSHLNLSDLTIKLISASGTESILMDQPTKSVYEGGLAFKFSSRSFIGEEVNGDWKLLITDSKTGDAGYLNSWKLSFFGKLDDGTDDLYVYTDEFSKLADSSRVVLSDTDGGNDTINAAAVSTDTTINLNAGEISEIAGREILISGGIKGEEFYQKQELLPIKESELTSKTSDLNNRKKTLAADNIELEGIGAAINAKVDEHIQKSAEYQSALELYNGRAAWFNNHTYQFTLDGVHIYLNKTTGGLAELSNNQRTQKINDLTNALNAVNSKVPELNTILQQYHDLYARSQALPTEIADLQNEITSISDQITQLQSEITFIETYLNSFNDNGSSAIENVYTGDGNDTIIGSDLDNKIWGGRGENTLTGNGGLDTFIIKENSDTIDTITDFKIGEDKIDLTDFGNISFSDLNISQNGANSEITFTSGQKIILKNTNIEQILADSFTGIIEITNPLGQIILDNTTVGTTEDDQIIKFGFDNDAIHALDGDDKVNGSFGDDIIYGGAGNDNISGGHGDDIIYADGDLTTNGSIIGNDVRGGENRIFGDDGDDIILGGSGNDHIEGGNGDDTLNGGSGNDTIVVGYGNNRVQAGDGDDIIDLSGAGSSFTDYTNFISGGEGNDKFIFDTRSSFKNETTIISDFDVTNLKEKIDLSELNSINRFSDLKISQQGVNAELILSHTSFRNTFQTIILKNTNASELTASNFIITNEAPESANDSASTNEDESVIINILNNDQDDKTNSSQLIITTTKPINGTVTINSNGTITYKPDDNFNGIDQFEYQLADAGGLLSETAKVIVNISAINDAPVVTKIISNQLFYSDAGFNFNANDVFTEVDGEGLNYSASLIDGTPLPSWISFDSSTLEFSGTSPSENTSFTIKLTATDDSNNSTSININLEIDNSIIRGTDGNDMINGTTDDDVIDGGEGDDIINGGEGDDILFGGDGNDILHSSGSGSDDILNGGSGSDTFVIGNDITSNDIITDFDVNDPNEKIDLSLFRDVASDLSHLTIKQVGSDAEISFQTRSKTILIKNISIDDLTIDKFIGMTDNKNSNDNLVLNGSNKNDLLVGGHGNDIINGDLGNDTIKGGAGNNLLTGGEGDDIFVISKNPNKTDIITDLEAFDAVQFDGFADDVKLDNLSYTEEENSVTFNLDDGQKLTFQNAKAADVLHYLSYTNIVSVTNSYDGTTADEKIILSTSVDGKIINGGDGDDIISGGNGDDTINGGKGNDILRGGKWFDTFEIEKNPGDKDIILDLSISNMVDSLVLKGFASDNISDYMATQNGDDVTVDLEDDQTLTLKNFKLEDLPYIPNYSNRIVDLKSLWVNDTDGNDIIFTDSWYHGGAIITESGKGNDVLTGARFAKDLFIINKNPGDNDFIRYVDTGRNDKVVLMGFDNDIINNITFLPTSDPYMLIMDLGDGQILRTYGVLQSEFKQYIDVEKTIDATDGDDTLSAGYLNTEVDGGDGNDTITGNDLGNILTGGNGDDKITDGSGDDRITGGNGDDEINNKAGNDVIDAGMGDDKIILTDDGNKIITGGEGADTYKISAFTGDITITDFDVNNINEKIDLRNANIYSFFDLSISQVGNDSIIQISDSQKIILQNIDLESLSADNFTLYNNNFDGSPLNDRLYGDNGDDFINGYGGNDSVYLRTKGYDTINLGDGNDSFSVSGNGYSGDDNITGGAGNDEFSIDLGYHYGDSNYTLTINDFEATNPQEKIYIKNGSFRNMDFDEDLELKQIGDDVKITVKKAFNGKSILLKNVNLSDLNEDNIIVPVEPYQTATTEDDDQITFDPNAGSKNILGDDRSISLDGTLTHASTRISGNYTTITLREFNSSLDRIKVSPNYRITDYSDLPLEQDGDNVIMNFTNEDIPLTNTGSSFGSTRYTKVILENVNISDLDESSFIFYNHSTSSNDSINGLGGNDYIEGGDGDDNIYGGDGNDEIIGGAGNDRIYGDYGDDTIYGGDGNDYLADIEGTNELYGGNGNDVIDIFRSSREPLSNNKLYGEGGEDIFYLNAGNNTVKGGTGNDYFSANNGHNDLYGEEGVDNYTISKAITYEYIGGEYIAQNAESTTIIHDFDPLAETISLTGFELYDLNQFDISQDVNDVVFTFSELQTLRLKNISINSLNQNNIIFPNEQIPDNYTYSFDDRTNEYSINNIKDLIAESPEAFSYNGPVAEISSYYDPISRQMASNFDITSNKIHLGKIKSLVGFEDISINQYEVEGQQFTLIDLKNGTFVKVNGFHNLTADNFTFNKAPIANLETVAINEDHTQIFDVLAEASDAESDILKISNISDPSNGTATIITDKQGNQKISYVPNANFNGSDQLNYTISDSRGGLVTATLNIEVSSVNDAPVATINSSTVTEDSSVIIDVLSGASDVDGDVITIDAITNPLNGTAEIIDGKITYTPNDNYNGDDNFNYTISDEHGGSVTKTITVTINAENDAPSINISSPISDEKILQENSFSLTFEEESFIDIDGDIMSYSATLSNGEDLPDWLNFDASTRTFYGHVSKDLDLTTEDNKIEVSVTANDGKESVSQDFIIDIISNKIVGDSDDSSSEDLVGTDNNDILISEGLDSLTGGAGADIFVINKSNSDSIVATSDTSSAESITTITDFDPTDIGETIDISAFGNITDFGDLKMEDGSDSINLGNNQAIRIENVDFESLQASNFVFAKNFAPEIADNRDINDNHFLSDNIFLNSTKQNQGALPVLENSDGKTVNPDPISNHVMTVNQDGEVIVTFKNSLAGYKNAIGWYTIGKNGEITNPELLFKSAKAIESNTEFSLGNLETGIKVGFFLIANGGNGHFLSTDHSKSSHINDIDLDSGYFSFVNNNNETATIFDDKAPKLLFNNSEDGKEYTINKHTYHSYNNVNLNPDKKLHAGAGWDADKGQLLLGFEDLYGGGDKDYNDILFYLKMNGDKNSKQYEYTNAPSIDVTLNDANDIHQTIIEITNNQEGDRLIFDNNNYIIDDDSGAISKIIDLESDIRKDLGISLSINDDNNQITISGEQTSAIYQNILNAIRFINVSDNPDNNLNLTRNISVQVTDEDKAISVIEMKIIIVDNPIIGTKNNDSLAGKTNNDLLIGKSGDDILEGGKGDDIIYGEDGNDTLNGGENNDIILGGLGLDLLTGGSGADSFNYLSLNDSSINAADIIQDFEQGSDKINLSIIEEDLSFNSLEFAVENGHTIIKDKNSDFAIDLNGEFSLNDGDFIF